MNTLKIAHTNGEELEAPLGVWFVAMFRVLSDEQQGEVFKQASDLQGEMIAALLSGKFGKYLPVNLTTEKKSIAASNGKPSVVTTDNQGRKHHRIFLESGTYEGKGKSLNPTFNGKEQQ